MEKLSEYPIIQAVAEVQLRLLLGGQLYRQVKATGRLTQQGVRYQVPTGPPAVHSPCSSLPSRCTADEPFSCPLKAVSKLGARCFELLVLYPAGADLGAATV